MILIITTSNNHDDNNWHGRCCHGPLPRPLQHPGGEPLLHREARRHPKPARQLQARRALNPKP